MAEVDKGGTAVDKEIDGFSIAFNVNDNLSVSVGTQDTKYDRNASADTTETVDGMKCFLYNGCYFIESSLFRVKQ